jgi:hypothetical protein
LKKITGGVAASTLTVPAGYCGKSASMAACVGRLAASMLYAAIDGKNVLVMLAGSFQPFVKKSRFFT